MNTQEGNKLIAEFMGVKCWEADGFVFTSDSSVPHFRLGSIILKYHQSWDWLMPVVEKIMNFEGEIFIVKINNSYARIKDNRDGSIISVYPAYHDQKLDRLEATWMVCVKFIKWYNKQNKRDSSKECKKSNPLKCSYPHCECMAMMHK